MGNRMDIEQLNQTVENFAMKQHLKDFLKTYSLEDIKQTVIGELNEYSTEDFTAFFGNGELILCDAKTENETVYVVDRIGFNEFLSEF